MQTLLRYLPHFSPDGGVKTSGRDGPASRSADASTPAPPPKAPTFSQEEVSLAVSQAVRDAVTKAKAELAASEAARKEQAEQFEVMLADRLTTARAEWAEAEGDRLAAAIGEAYGTLETRVSEVLSRILLPFVGDAMRDRAVEEFRHAIAALMNQPHTGEPQAPVITIRGSDDLLNVLRERLGEPEGVAFEPGPQTEIEATCGDTVIESRLEVWMKLLTSANEGNAEEGGARG